MKPNTATPTPQKSLRLLPGVVIVVLQWIIRFLTPMVIPVDEAVMFGVFGGILGGLAIAVWWLFFSRAPLFERWCAIALVILSLVSASHYIHISIATANMGLMFTIYSIPVMSLAFVIWAVASSRLSGGLRRITMVVTIVLASGFWTLLRTNGMTSDLHNDFSWRWSKSSEDLFMAQTSNKTTTPDKGVETGPNWSGFRGPSRDGIVHGVRIATDWKASPPIELWRRQVGPGCSSFAINGDLLYTQEQRGDDEAVTCYSLTTGKPVWIHNDKARFWDSHAGAGPRATPTLSNGFIYTMGATSILNVLDAKSGNVIWSRNAATDTKVEHTGWGFTGSPLIVDSTVIVAVSGKLAAYSIATGQPRWFGPDGGKGYSSPQLFTIKGIPQVVLLSDVGATSIAPSDGKILWQYSWPSQDRVLQPARTEEGDFLISNAMPYCIRRITVENEPDGWKIKERWTSEGLKPNFNDFVVHKNHAYGFNGRSLACIDIKDGKRNWQDGRYGGQIILLADQDLILVLSEKGELALVEATPDKFKELARFPAIKGKTWNHPVLVNDVLVVRNGQEMVAFRLPLLGNKSLL